MTLTKLTKELDNLSLEKLSKYGSGELILLCNNMDTWGFHIVHGQLLYVTGGFHPVRRWDRALKQHRSNWNWSLDSYELSDNQPWECQLIDRGLRQKQLTTIQAKLVIRTIFQECLFELSSYTDFKSNWKSSQEAISILCRVVALSANEIRAAITAAIQMHQRWQDDGMGHLNPTLAPILQQEIDPQRLPVLDKYLNGQFTLWDIALEVKKSVNDVTLSLMPLVDKGILQFREIADLPLPSVQKAATATYPLPEITTTKPSQKQSLIACIDDSPVLTHTLKKILMPAGYKLLSIEEPMRGFGQLIENKPDLILLDLLLPNADGYSICKFLRETPVFKKTPIIILTAKNTPFDRARAQLAGATEFLGKPPEPQELLQMVQKYLGQ